MRNDLELEAIIEDYLNGKLTADEQKAFEQLRSNDPIVDHKVVAHKVFLESMKQYADILLLKQQMDNAHAQIDVEGLSTQLRPHSSRIVRFWRSNRSAISIAASFLILSFITLYSIHDSSKQANSFQETSINMQQDLAAIRIAQANLIKEFNNNDNKGGGMRDVKFGGSGFAISSNGYILTNYHVIKDAKDSIYVQNNKGVSFKVSKYYTDPVNDIAILKISDKSFSHLGSLPYVIKKTTASIGEEVYTLGYSKNDVVLGDGYVSSKTGFNGDTLAYQVAIPVNPGNSGGPLLDNKGNIVGVINGKEKKTDGASAAFAVKPKYIMEALNAIPPDSLTKRVAYGKKSILQGLKRENQVKKIQDYVFMIKVY